MEGGRDRGRRERSAMVVFSIQLYAFHGDDLLTTALKDVKIMPYLANSPTFSCFCNLFWA